MEDFENLYELDGIISEIIGEGFRIEEESLLDSLMKKPELSTYLAKSAEFVQKRYEIRKRLDVEHREIEPIRETPRDELRILLNDITTQGSNVWDENGNSRKFYKETYLTKKGTKVMICRLTDDFGLK